jgi:signal transduction histidine kinase
MCDDGERGYGRLMSVLHKFRRDVRAHAWDYGSAAAMVVVAIVVLITRIDVQDVDVYRYRADTAWSWAATIAVCASLVGRRRWPLRSLAVGIALVVPLELAGHRDNVAFFALVLTFYSVAAVSPMRLAWRAIVMVGALYALLLATGTITIPTAPLIGPLFLATGFALGRMVRHTRARSERQVEAAIQRAAHVQQAVALEEANARLRMAQELHDVVAHSLSVIAVQAGIGAHLIDRQPAEAARALEAIRTTSGATEGELARLVDNLRGGQATEAPAALTGVALLVDQIRATGLPISFHAEGDLSVVPAGVSLAAYRIVQEALTNVVRHAGRAVATVTVRAVDDHVEVTIEDNGHGSTGTSDSQSQAGGNGLIGMTERAQMYGGTVRYGPRVGGGFRVLATLPYAASQTSAEGAVTLASRSAAVLRTRPRLTAWMWDALLAASLAVLATLEIHSYDPVVGGPHYNRTSAWAWFLRIGCCLTLSVRRRYPTLCYALCWALGLALVIGNYQVGMITFVLWIGLYTVANRAGPPRIPVALAGTYLGIVVIAWSRPPDLTTPGAVWVGVFFTASAVAGYVARRDRERRAADLTVSEASVEDVSRSAQLAIATERLRIADELGTVITRSIRAIATHAAAGSQLLDVDPKAAKATLDTISTISRDALNDLRRLLKRIRTESEPVMYAPIAPTAAPARLGAAR